jgi:hypothetical protein
VLQHLRVWSEYNTVATPIIKPLIRIDMWYPKSIGYWGSVQMMKDRLDSQIQQLEAAPDGERAIMLWWVLTRELYVAKGADPLAVYEAGAVPTRRALAMLKPLSDELKRRGIPIDLIFLDNEGGFGIFDMGIRWVRKVMRSSRARRKMPENVRSVNPDHLVQSHANFVNARDAWDHWAYKLKYDALKRVITQSGYFNIQPASGGPVQSASAVNFWSTNPLWPIYDYNGWELDRTTSLDGRSSGPSSYVGFNGSRYFNRVHHWIWNDFINLLNHTRSCLGRPGSVVHPVLSHPWYCHPWMQEQMIAHMVRNGINWSQNRCAFLYWNAYDPHINDPILASIVQRHDLAYPLRRDLPEIPLDTDVVTTVDYTTTYSDFLTNMASVIDPP